MRENLFQNLSVDNQDPRSIGSVQNPYEQDRHSAYAQNNLYHPSSIAIHPQVQARYEWHPETGQQRSDGDDVFAWAMDQETSDEKPRPILVGEDIERCIHFPSGALSHAQDFWR